MSFTESVCVLHIKDQASQLAGKTKVPEARELRKRLFGTAWNPFDAIVTVNVGVSSGTVRSRIFGVGHGHRAPFGTCFALRLSAKESFCILLFRLLS